MNTITVPVKVSTDTLTFKVDVSADRAFAVGVDTAVKRGAEHYLGPYEVEPSANQKVLATAGLFMEYDVTVEGIPADFVGSDITRRDSDDLTASGATITAPAGYYESSASKAVALGSRGNSAVYISTTATEKNYTVKHDNATSGYYDASALKTDGVVSFHRQQETVTPTESSQTVTPTSSTYYLESVAVDAIPSTYVGSGIDRRTANDMTVFGPYVTAAEGYYEIPCTTQIDLGTEGTPTATKSAVNNHAIAVTPSVTNTGGYIAGETKTGTVVSVSASELVSGTYTVDSSGTKDVTNYASATIPAGTAGTPALTVSAVENHSKTIRASVINQTGWITGGTVSGASTIVSASDLVSGSQNITANANNIDVTNLASVNVQVPSGSPSLQTKSKSYTPSTSQQTEAVTADGGYDGLDTVNVTVNAMPSGSVTAPATITGSSATVSTGTNTLTLSKTVSVTPNVTTSGYVSSGTAGNSNISLTANVQTKGASTYRASTSQQTVASGTYLTGALTIAPVSQTNLSAENIKSGTTISISDGANNIWAVTGTYSGGGGTSNFTLLGSKSLGTISTSSTTDTDTGQTIVVTGWNDYDLLVCECSVNTQTNNRHTCSTRTAWLTASTNVTTKNGCTFATATWNSKRSSSGTTTTRAGTTPYGVYAKAGTISGSNLTITIYQRYNSTSTGTINGAYTMRVYGVKIYDLIGG